MFDLSPMSGPQEMDMTQPQATQEESEEATPELPDESPAPQKAPQKPWARLIKMAEPFRVVEIFDTQLIIGRAGNSNAQEQINDEKISLTHCKIFCAPDGTVRVLDQSSNGTFVNRKLVGKGSMHPLDNGDELTLLNPKLTTEHSAHEKPTNYTYLFTSLLQRRAAPPSQPRLLQGTSFCSGGMQDSCRRGEYEEICKLGRGAFAVVVKVRHRASRRLYAMKVMEKRRVLGQATLGRDRSNVAGVTEKILSEARILKGLDHPNVIRFHDIMEDDSELLLVMELVEGGELFEYVNKHGPFDEPGARAVMSQLLQALEYLHSRNIAHRDLKLENILLVESSPSIPPSQLQVKIADFGLAKLVGGGQFTSTFCGTPQYFAPEVLESRSSTRGYDSACDVWSLGVIMYILLMAYAPFDETRPRWDTGNAPVPSIFDQIRAGVRREHFRAEDWQHLSRAAMELVRQLLVVDPTCRLSCHAALRHPWITGAAEPTGAHAHAPMPVHAPAPRGPATHARAAFSSPPLSGEDIESCSDDEEEGAAARRLAHGAASKPSKRQRVLATASRLQTCTAPARSATQSKPPPASSPQFKQPLQPSTRQGLAQPPKAPRPLASQQHSSGRHFGPLEMKARREGV